MERSVNATAALEGTPTEIVRADQVCHYPCLVDLLEVPVLEVVKLDLADDTETIEQSLAGFSGYRDVYIIVSSDAGPTNYKFGLMK